MSHVVIYHMLVFWCSNNTNYSESNYLGWWGAEDIMTFCLKQVAL